MEYLDALNENGEKTGIVIEKDQAHRGEGVWHRTVHVLIINRKNEVLLQKRAMCKTLDPGLWHLSVTGYVNAGESSKEGMIREIKEEIGIDFNENELEFLFDLKDVGTAAKDIVNKEFASVYIAYKDIDIKNITLQKKEVENVKWIPLQKFKIIVKNRSKELVNWYGVYEMIIERLA
ncbi:MAG: NUDIX domain-containing protein [Clostridia bacterium]|jgi:isopentenyldiphosphate isomerase|nr:NUDIX domain-containing protein [Clostridia bacterium]